MYVDYISDSLPERRSLMEAINAADPHFVRCVNPNAEKKAECFQDQKAVEQLRCPSTPLLGAQPRAKSLRSSYTWLYLWIQPTPLETPVSFRQAFDSDVSGLVNRFVLVG